MKKMKYVLMMILFSSCSELIIDEEEPISQSNNFDILWDDFDKHYSLFKVRDIDWDKLYLQYRSQVNDTISDEQLWTILSGLLENLNDSHTVLYDANVRQYRSGYTLNEQSATGFSEDLLHSKYLDLVTKIPSEDNLAYAKVKNKNIGYIYLGAMDGSNLAIIDEVVDALKDYRAIILDIRQNTGGDDRYAARIAQAFSDDKHFIYTVQTRNGIDHNDFDKSKKYFTASNQKGSYQKPVIVLTDRKTISAAEVFLLHMKSFEKTIQLGDTTAGDFSTVSNRRFLPNGWSYTYSIQKFLLPSGASLDGIGHTPDIYFKNMKSDIDSSNDKVLEGAIQYIYDQYGIE